jgi:hypothetical protein
MPSINIELRLQQLRRPLGTRHLEMPEAAHLHE